MHDLSERKKTIPNQYMLKDFKLNWFQLCDFSHKFLTVLDPVYSEVRGLYFFLLST